MTLSTTDDADRPRKKDMSKTEAFEHHGRGAVSSIITNEPQRLIDELTSDMTRGDLIAVLEDLRFQGQQLRTLRLDRGVRDYLLAVLRGR